MSPNEPCLQSNGPPDCHPDLVVGRHTSKTGASRSLKSPHCTRRVASRSPRRRQPKSARPSPIQWNRSGPPRRRCANSRASTRSVRSRGRHGRRRNFCLVCCTVPARGSVLATVGYRRWLGEVAPTATMVNASYLIAVHTCQLRASGSQAS